MEAKEQLQAAPCSFPNHFSEELRPSGKVLWPRSANCLTPGPPGLHGFAGFQLQAPVTFNACETGLAKEAVTRPSPPEFDQGRISEETMTSEAGTSAVLRNEMPDLLVILDSETCSHKLRPAATGIWEISGPRAAVSGNDLDLHCFKASLFERPRRASDLHATS